MKCTRQPAYCRQNPANLIKIVVQTNLRQFETYPTNMPTYRRRNLANLVNIITIVIQANIDYLSATGTEPRTCLYSLSFVPLYTKIILKRGEVLINVKKTSPSLARRLRFPFGENSIRRAYPPTGLYGIFSVRYFHRSIASRIRRTFTLSSVIIACTSLRIANGDDSTNVYADLALTLVLIQHKRLC